MSLHRRALDLIQTHIVSFAWRHLADQRAIFCASADVAMFYTTSLRSEPLCKGI